MPVIKKIHRFFQGFAVDGTAVTANDAAVRHQLSRVLKLAVGEKIVVMVDGVAYVVELSDVRPEAVTGVIVEQVVPTHHEPERAVILACAVLKKDHFELVVQKATELGVTGIVPLVTTHTVKLGLNGERLRRVILEAAEQCERVTLPTLQSPITLANLLTDGRRPILLLDPSGVSWDPIEPLPAMVTVAIGPEGGWSQDELALARSSGARIVSIGGLILRGETAAIVAAYQALRAPQAA